MRAGASIALVLVLAGCNRDRGAAADAVPPAVSEGTPSSSLPTPEAAPGASVTGMPTQPPPPPAEPAVVAAEGTAPIDAGANGADADVASAVPGTDAGGLPTPVDTTTPAPAAPVDVAGASGLVSQYMSALGSGALLRAQGLWATTPNDSVVMELARGEGASVGVGMASADATGRVSVPVEIRARGADGNERHVLASYALQRSPTGAWRILSATVRDAGP
ncbi:MAG TPA: hypothetical protein VIG54_07360 [Lysobacter sp.]